jgi:UDP-glucose 4-epimerase
MGDEHVIPELSKKLLHAKNTSQKMIEIQGTGKETRSFCYIDDFVAAFKLVLDLPNNSKQEIYNIGSENEISIEKIAILLANILKVDINFEYKSGPKGGTLRRCPDISKLKELGFKPKYDLDVGIEKYCKWLVLKNGQK